MRPESGSAIIYMSSLFFLTIPTSVSPTMVLEIIPLLIVISPYFLLTGVLIVCFNLMRIRYIRKGRERKLKQTGRRIYFFGKSHIRQPTAPVLHRNAAAYARTFSPLLLFRL